MPLSAGAGAGEGRLSLRRGPQAGSREAQASVAGSRKHENKGPMLREKMAPKARPEPDIMHQEI